MQLVRAARQVGDVTLDARDRLLHDATAESAAREDDRVTRQMPDRLERRIDRARRPATESGPLTWDDIGYLVQGLAFAPRTIHRATAAVTERHSLGPRGAWIINLIAANIAYPHELADVFQIGRSLVSAELARLADAGLIVSKPGRDRRRTELALTETGEAALGEIRGEIDAIMREGLAGYSPEQIRLCARMLGDLRTSTRDAGSD